MSDMSASNRKEEDQKKTEEKPDDVQTDKPVAPEADKSLEKDETKSLTVMTSDEIAAGLKKEKSVRANSIRDISDQLAQIDLTNRDLTTRAVNLARPTYPWLWKDLSTVKYDNDVFTLSPDGNTLLRQIDGSEYVPSFEGNIEYLIERLMLAAKHAVRKYGFFRDVDTVMLDREANFKVLAEGGWADEKMMMKYLTDLDAWRAAWRQRQADPARRVTDIAKTVVNQVELRSAQAQLFVSPNPIEAPLSPDMFFRNVRNWLVDPLAFAQALNVAAPADARATPPETWTKHNFYVLGDDVTMPMWNEMMAQSRSARNELFNMMHSINTRVFSFTSVDRTSAVRDISGTIQNSVTDALPTSGLASTITSAASDRAMRMLITACALPSTHKLVYRPAMYTRSPLVLFGAIAYIAMVPDMLADANSWVDCQQYVFEHFVKKLHWNGRGNYQYVKYNAAHTQNHVTDDALGGLRRARAVGKFFPNIAHVNGLAVNNQNAIMNFITMPFRRAGWGPPNGNWPAARNNVAFRYPYRADAVQPDLISHRLAETMDFLAAAEQLMLQYNNNRETGMYQGISRLVRMFHEHFIPFYDNVTRASIALQALGLTPTADLPSKKELVLDHMSLLPMLINLDYTSFSMNDSYFDAILWARGFRESMNLYDALAGRVWLNIAFRNSLSKGESMKLITRLTEVCAPWFSVPEVKGWFDTLNHEYKPTIPRQNHFGSAIITMGQRLSTPQMLRLTGQHESVDFMAGQVVNPAGLNYLTVSNAQTLTGNNLQVLNRDQVSYDKALTAGTRIVSDVTLQPRVLGAQLYTFSVPWVFEKVVRDVDDDVPPVADDINIITEKLRHRRKITIETHYRFNDNDLPFQSMMQYSGVRRFMLNDTSLETIDPVQLFAGVDVRSAAPRTTITWYKIKDEHFLSQYDIIRVDKVRDDLV
jgi:hypothetical protein